MSPVRLFACLAAFALAGESAAQVPATRRYGVQPLPFLGGSDCKTMAINATGQIVGTYRERDSLNGVPVKLGFLFDQQRLWRLPLPRSSGNRFLPDSGPPAEARALDLNDSATVVGSIRRSAAKARFGWEAVVWDWKSRTVRRLPTGKTGNSFAHAINFRGDIAGAYEDESGNLRAFACPAGETNKVNDIGTLGGPSAIAYDINDHGEVTGQSTTRDGAQRAFRLRGAGMRLIGTLGGAISQGNAINSNGDVAGVAQTANGHFHAFLCREDRLLDLGTLGGNFSYAYAIYGVLVVGTAEDRSLVARAFLFDGLRMWDLNQLIPANSGWFLTEALHINSRAQIVCQARNTAGQVQPVLLTPR